MDRLPVIKTFLRQDWQFLLEYYQWKYHKPVRPVQRRSDRSSLKTSSALSVALLIITSMIIMAATANISARSVDRLSSAGNMSLLPSVSSVPTAAIPLSRKRTGKFFRIHKCVNRNCSFYKHNLQKVEDGHLQSPHGRSRYKLHYIYREFTMDFFRMDLDSLPKPISYLDNSFLPIWDFFVFSVLSIFVSYHHYISIVVEWQELPGNKMFFCKKTLLIFTCKT